LVNPKEHDPQGSVGFPLGSTPDESFANMMAYLRDAAAKLDRPAPPPSFEPANLRDIAAIGEAVVIEQEVRKGPEGNATVVARADLLRRDVWDRWRAGQGFGLVDTPIGEAIGKLADVADRQLQLMETGNHLAIRRGAAVPLATDRSTAVEERGAPLQKEPESRPDPSASSAPLFSVLEDEYVAIREGAGATKGTISTIRTRVQVFKDLMGDRPLDCYVPMDIQQYVNELQYLPLQYNREGGDHEELRAMGARTAVDINKRDRSWETLGIKTMQDGYVQVVKAIIGTATGLHRLRDPFAGYTLRWPDDAKPSVKRETLDHGKLNVVFKLGVASGYLDDAMMGPLCLLSTRRIGILPYIRGCDIDVKHGVDIIRVNGIVYDEARKVYKVVPYKTGDSLRFFVLHDLFRRCGFVDWARAQGQGFVFRMLQNCKDPADAASKRMNRLMKQGGAAGMNIEVAHSLRHGGKDVLIEEEIASDTARLQMGHQPSDDHAGYGARVELNRKQCRELAHFELPTEIDWSMFDGLDFEAMAKQPRKMGRPKRIPV
jgi:integrase